MRKKQKRRLRELRNARERQSLILKKVFSKNVPLEQGMKENRLTPVKMYHWNKE